MDSSKLPQVLASLNHSSLEPSSKTMRHLRRRITRTLKMLISSITMTTSESNSDSSGKGESRRLSKAKPKRPLEI